MALRGAGRCWGDKAPPGAGGSQKAPGVVQGTRVDRPDGARGPVFEGRVVRGFELGSGVFRRFWNRTLPAASGLTGAHGGMSSDPAWRRAVPGCSGNHTRRQGAVRRRLGLCKARGWVAPMAPVVAFSRAAWCGVCVA